jgi:hypothetical protein
MRINFRTIKIFIKIFIIHRILTPSFSNAEQLNPKVHNSFCEVAVDLTTDNWSVSICNSGIFCIGSTLKQTFPLIRLTHQAVPMSPLISIFSSNVTVDLMNRYLSAQTPTGQGVVAEDTSRMPRHTIEIRSGTIRTASQPTIFMVNSWNSNNVRFGSGRFAIAESAGDLTQYKPTEFVLENLTLTAENHVIIMQGMNNIIRHCKIIGGNGTVNVFGPNLIFEDNEIILHARAQAEASDQAPAALYLEDAAGSVVRNNRITIKGNTSGSQAIVLKNSPNVTLQGNTISGTDSLYNLLDEQSSVMATDNHLNR